MKCYCVTFDLNNSTFQIGIKCYKDGELLDAYELHD